MIGKRMALLAASALGLSGCMSAQPVVVETQDSVTAAPAVAEITTPVFRALPPEATANAALWPKAKSPAAITDPATETRITEIISRMTIEQKVGQLVQADIGSITPADVEKYPLGSLLAGGNSGPYGNERGSSSDWSRLMKEYHDASMKSSGIPMIFGIDAVHGHSNVPRATIFPHNVGLGAMRDPALMQAIGAVTAIEVASTGIPWTFAPTLAVPQDGRWGRAYEGYSSDPAIIAEYSKAMINGIQGSLQPGKVLDKDHIAATAKHFVADGGTLDGKDQGDAQISEQELIDVHAAGYKPAIDAGALAVMVSFSSWNGVKNHGNKSLLTDVIKGQMGFEGFLVGDWNGHGQVEGCEATHCPQAINAGLDMFMAPDSWKALFENTVEDVKAGRIGQDRLNDAVRRILRVKAKVGLLDGRPILDAPEMMGRDTHRAIARRAAAESLVLLKNEGRALPIRAGASVLVAGDGADSMAKQTGGWTITWQGTDTTKADFPQGQTIFEGIRDAVGEAGGKATLSVDGSFTSKPDVAIVVFGEDPYAEFQGDVPNLDFEPTGAKSLALLKSLKAKGIKTVSVFLSGRPMFVSPEMNASDAFVAAWLPGSEGGGVADVLVADKSGKTKRDFRGTLSFPWPKDAAAPVKEPLFDLGYGLSYAKPGKVGTLSEDLGVAVADVNNVENYFVKGRAAAPWAIQLGDADGAVALDGTVMASPSGNLSVRPIDVGAQEDSLLLDFSGPGYFTIDGPEADIMRQLTGAFGMRLTGRVDKVPSGKVELAVAGVPIDITAALQEKGEVSLLVPLRCYADKGANFARMLNAARITSAGTFQFALQRLSLEPIGVPTNCP